MAVPAGGVAGEPGVGEPEVGELGVELCPAELEPLGGTAPPEGVLCATVQLAQHNATDNNVSFPVNMSRPPKIEYFLYFLLCANLLSRRRPRRSLLKVVVDASVNSL